MYSLNKIMYIFFVLCESFIQMSRKNEAITANLFFNPTIQ